MFKFPYGLNQQLNLNWFIRKFKELVDEWNSKEESIDGALQAEIDRAESALSDVYSARDTAVAAKDDAISAKNDAINAKNDAQTAKAGADTAKSNADTAALKSEGYAVGEQNGSPVGSSSPYYNNNAKYNNQQAGINKFMAEAWAVGTMNGTPVSSGTIQYENNAKYYAQQAGQDAADAHQDKLDADADALATGQDRSAVSQDKDDVDYMKDQANAAALRSEGFAVGEQNGTPVDSSSPYYHNNAEYFKNQAEAAASGADGTAAQAMIAGAEASSTASAPHTAGTFFRLSGVLYEATDDIAVGDTITVGTNCKVAVVGDVLSEQSDRIETIEDYLEIPEAPSQFTATSTASWTQKELGTLSLKKGVTYSYTFSIPEAVSYTVYISIRNTTASSSILNHQIAIGETSYSGTYTPESDCDALFRFQVGTTTATTVTVDIANNEFGEIERVDLIGGEKQHRMIAGVIRNTGSGWEFITDANHAGDMNCVSVTANEDGQIRINYGGIHAKKVISLIVAPDETFASLGYTVGSSVAATYSLIEVYQYVPDAVGGVISCDSEGNISISLSANGVTDAVWDSTNNYMTISHRTVSNENDGYRATGVSVVPFGTGASPFIAKIYSFTNNSISLCFYDLATGNVITNLDDSIKFFFARESTTKVRKVKLDANDIVSASGNFWFMGIFEL